MIGESVVVGYAQALFEVASEKGIADEVEKDLEGIKELLRTNKKFRNILYHPSIAKTDKKDIINKTIGPQCSNKWVRNFLFILIEKRRERMLDSLPDVFKEVAGRIKGVTHVKVQTAFPLTDSKIIKLKGNLEKLMKKKVELETEINKDIIGGMVIRIGNKIIDGSVTNHLKNLKKNLSKTALA
ncbi:MAG: F0F1 ATP synthase delta subunit [Candidatus Scalindua rubra]|uniref:ATP synthase subunit delta n=1 Tax=Candidatus Scalindua rubra TaxID=1872076 RepID=A0A1E3X8B0_9BACT|nr:MAG: F0F1 ATP synthase delta subunit [Candidatus Scalindua rubra]